MDAATDWVAGATIECSGCELQMTEEITITVGDSEAPTAIAQNIEVRLDANNSATVTASMINNGSSDNCSNITLGFLVSNSVQALSRNVVAETTTQYPTSISYDQSNLGTNSVTLIVVDGSGNQSTATATVTVKEYALDQTITFAGLANKTYGDANFDISASSDANLPISFSIVSGPAIIVGQSGGILVETTKSKSQVSFGVSPSPAVTTKTLEITGAGTIVIEASQEGNDDYAAATPVQQTIVVSKAVITATPDDATITYGEATPNFNIVYSGFIGGEDKTAFSQEPTVTVVAEGKIILMEASRVESVSPSNYNAGDYKLRLSGGSASNYVFNFTDGNFTVNKKDQIITITSIDDMLTTDSPFDVTATIDTQMPLTYVVTGPATLTGTEITLDGTSGTVTVTVDQAGDLNHNAASATTTFKVNKPLGIEDEVASKLSIYPNPVVDYLTIKGANVQSVKVVGLNGQLLIDKTTNTDQIDLSDLKNGIYLIEVKTDRETLITTLLKN